MIPSIWSRSAKGTPRTDDGLGSSGTPRTDRSSEPTSEMERRLHEQLSAHWQRPSMDRLAFTWWTLLATIRHVFGIHTMIPLEEWDFVEEVVQLKGSICWKCDHRE